MLRVIARVRVQHFDPMLAWEASQQRRSRSNGEIFVLRKILARVFVVALLLGMPGIAVSAEPLPLFSSEQKAQQHCPSDIVVWLNLPSGIYHLKGQRLSSVLQFSAKVGFENSLIGVPCGSFRRG
jgi:hypothetical protein